MASEARTNSSFVNTLPSPTAPSSVCTAISVCTQSSGRNSLLQPPSGVAPRKPAQRISRIFMKFLPKQIQHSNLNSKQGFSWTRYNVLFVKCLVSVSMRSVGKKMPKKQHSTHSTAFISSVLDLGERKFLAAFRHDACPCRIRGRCHHKNS